MVHPAVVETSRARRRPAPCSRRCGRRRRPRRTTPNGSPSSRSGRSSACIAPRRCAAGPAHLATARAATRRSASPDPPYDENTRVTEPDFEAEGLLEGLEGDAREARLALLQDLDGGGVPLEEMNRRRRRERLRCSRWSESSNTTASASTRREIAEKSGSTSPSWRSSCVRSAADSRPGRSHQHDGRPRGDAPREAVPRRGAARGGPARGDAHHRHGHVAARVGEPGPDRRGVHPSGIDERELAMRYAAAAQSMTPLLGATLRYAHDPAPARGDPPVDDHRGGAG